MTFVLVHAAARARAARSLLAGVAAWGTAAVAPCALPAGPADAAAQSLSARQDQGLVAAALGMRQLDGVKRVLMIAAHPDDEDTSLLAALARGMGAQTAYLSLTRGEGGQNLIGPRLHEGLGAIRTGELVAARALDGGAQYFTRAFDYGFSKSLDEARRMWPLDDVVRDVVYVVRTFRPHVMVSVFSGTPRDGHGQHQFAGVAAHEAFTAAGDPQRYPELAAFGADPWQPSKLYRSARFFAEGPVTRIPTGDFDPVLGRSHFQLAMESRSQHRSQDMGSGQAPGPRSTAVQLVATAKGAPTEEAASAEGTDDGGIFAGVDTTLIGQLGSPLPPGWPTDTARRLGEYQGALADAARSLSATRPHASVAALARAAATLRGLLADATVPARAVGRRVVEHRLAQVSETLLAAAGVVAEVRVGRDLLTPGESVVVDVNVWNGGPFALSSVAPRLMLQDGWSAAPTTESTVPRPRSPFMRTSVPPTPDDDRLGPGEIGRWSWRVEVPADARPSAPYYLAEPRNGALYAWPDDPSSWALPHDPAPIRADVALELAEARGGAVDPGGAAGPDSAFGPSGALEPASAFDPVTITAQRDGEYVGVDKALGEYRRRVHIAPAVSVAVDPPWMVWPATGDGSREVQVVVTNTSTAPRSGMVRLDAPAGWTVEPGSAEFAVEPDGAAMSFTFAVAAPGGAAAQGEHTFRAVAVEGGGAGDRRAGAGPATEHRTEIDMVDHPHIDRVLMARDAALRVSVVEVAVDAGLSVGYVMGSGDDGAAVLRQLGMRVEELDESRVRAGDFAGLDVVVLGVRAYETRPDLAAANDALLDFARSGGTVIAQYNKYEYPAGQFAPYPVSMNRPHDRVTDETAPVTFIAPDSPVLAFPNAIGSVDFEGWVQERGLYFLGEWDDRYTPVLQMADPGEDPKRGGLVVAPVGDGLYIYTGLAFFRQFPAGVPGAYRLFANLVSLQADAWPGRPVSE